MNVLFYLAHPSQFYVFRELIHKFSIQNNKVHILIKSKDILEKLLIQSGHDFVNIYSKVRGKSKYSLIKSVAEKNYKVYKYIKEHHIDFIISAASEISQVTKLVNIPSFIFNDDDIDVIKYSALFGWPFSTVIFAPTSCNMGRFKKKTVAYNGYQKLCYLHPNIFTADEDLVRRKNGFTKYFLIRSVSLTAHHDRNVRGLNYNLIEKIIMKLKPYGNVYISSETKLPANFAKYALEINPLNIHQYIFYSNILISDSQSMSHEAALLGTPSIRFNDLVGRIGVLEELEHKYKLTIGISTKFPERLLNKIDELLLEPDINNIYMKNRNKMLEEKIDVNKFVYWFIKNYPQSLAKFNEDPSIQYQFK